MKTTNQNHRSNYFYTFLYSGILSTFFIANSFANSPLIIQKSIESDNNFLVTTNMLICDSTKISKPEMSQDSQSDIENSISTIEMVNIKPIIETIIENEEVIESKEDFNLPTYSGRNLDDIILENEMIIESNRIDDTFPLNSNLIDTYLIVNRIGVITKKNANFEKL